MVEIPLPYDNSNTIPRVKQSPFTILLQNKQDHGLERINTSENLKLYNLSWILKLLVQESFTINTSRYLTVEALRESTHTITYLIDVFSCH